MLHECRKDVRRTTDCSWVIARQDVDLTRVISSSLSGRFGPGVACTPGGDGTKHVEASPNLPLRSLAGRRRNAGLWRDCVEDRRLAEVYRLSPDRLVGFATESGTA